MIPKRIHYCWFGRNPKSALTERCMASWRKHCPDYEIIEWNENNYDISQAPLFVQQAYNREAWGFVPDYIRLKVVYDLGGIYLDTDVELKKPLDHLLDCNAFFGFEDGKHIALGLGFGAQQGENILLELMQGYIDSPFILPNGAMDMTPAPQRDITTFLNRGLKQDDSEQYLPDKIHILPKRVLCPINYESGRKMITKDTVSIHWFDASWQTEEQKRQHLKNAKEKRRVDRMDFWQHLPNRIAKGLLGQQRYNEIKHRIKGGR